MMMLLVLLAVGAVMGIGVALMILNDRKQRERSRLLQGGPRVLP